MENAGVCCHWSVFKGGTADEMKHELGRTLLGFSYHCIFWLRFILYSAYSPLLCCLHRKIARNEMKLMQLSAGFCSPPPRVQHSWLLGRAAGERPASPARDRRVELRSYTSCCTGAPFLCCCGLWWKKLLLKYVMGWGGGSYQLIIFAGFI